jgi:nucleotide-binding universal stress UspA family protein
MRNVLVPLDGSPFGEAVLPTAVAYAAKTGATLHLVHVLDSPVLPFSFEGYAMFDPGWTERFRSESRRYLEGIASAHAGPAGVRTCVRLLEAPVVESLVEYAERSEIDLIVMATHGRGGVSRTWLGSVADELIREVRIPVLLLRPPVPTTGEEQAAVTEEVAGAREILVPLDGSPLAESALAPAMDVAALTGARLTLLNVAPPIYMAGLPYAPAAVTFDAEAYRLERARAEQYLLRISERIQPVLKDVRVLLVTHAQPAVAIRETALREGSDLIVLATHGRGGVARWALGGVADKLIRSGAAPVLVVRPATARGRADAPRSRQAEAVH